MKISNVFFLVTILLTILLLSNCKEKEDVLPLDDEIVPEEESFNYDYFSYYTNSVFQFNIKASDSNGDTYGSMSFNVESFDKNTHTTKVIVSKNFEKNIAIGDYFYVRKTELNALELSSDGVNWNLWVDCESFSTDFKFLMTGPVGKPGNLLGSVDRTCETSSISTDAGSLSTIK